MHFPIQLYIFLFFHVDQKVARDAETQTDVASSIYVPLFIPMFILKIVPPVVEIEHRQNYQEDELELIADDVSDDENSSLSTNSSRSVNSSEFTSWDEDELLQTEEDILADLD